MMSKLAGNGLWVVDGVQFYWPSTIQSIDIPSALAAKYTFDYGS